MNLKGQGFRKNTLLQDKNRQRDKKRAGWVAPGLNHVVRAPGTNLVLSLRVPWRLKNVK